MRSADEDPIGSSPRMIGSVSGLTMKGVDLGGPAMARIAKDYGYTLTELRKL